MHSENAAVRLSPRKAPPRARHRPVRRRRVARVQVQRPAPSKLEECTFPLLGLAILLSLLAHLAGKELTTSLSSAFEKLAQQKHPEKVEVKFVEKKPPPPPPEPPKVEPPKPIELPKPIARKIPLPPPPPDAPPPPPKMVDAPPPPTNEAKIPTDAPPIIVPGLTLSSTSTSGTFAVPVGNTLYGTPDKVAKNPTEVKPYKAAQYAPSYAITENPVYLNNVSEDEARALFPPEALKQEIESAVVSKIVIDDDGSVVKVVVQDDRTHLFEEATKKLLKKYRFKPAKLNGQAVATEIPFTIHWEIPY